MRTDDPAAREIEPFLLLLGLRDEYTARHSQRVGRLVAALGQRMGLTGQDLRELKQAGWLHDLGKIGVPDAILLKRGPLTAEEWEVMRCHPAWGADALGHVPGLRAVEEAVRFHHERWDGLGYPTGIAGDEIPFASRAVGVCDALCAVTEERPYRPPADLAGATTILRAGAGTNFEPGLVAEVLALAAERPDMIAPPVAPTPARQRGGANPVAPGARFRRSDRQDEPRVAPGLGRALLAADGLPALLESRERLLHLLSDLHPHAGRIADAIEADPGITAAVMRAAVRQSSGTGRPASVPAAVELLGTRGVAECLAGVPVFDVLERHRSSRLDAEQFRLHAVAVRRATSSIARAIDHRAANELTVMALLHDVGKVVLAQAHMSYPVEVLGGARTPEERVRAERLALGLDHAAATAAVLSRWGLHARVVTGASRHHDPGESRDALVIRLADLLAHHAAGWGVSRTTLLRAAAELDLTLADVRVILFELEAPGRPIPRPERTDDSPLTRAEVVVLRGVAAGKRNKEVAKELGLSPSTVRSHLGSCYAKLGVGDRARAVLVATDRGWL
jgi:HD-GYP domain-containing protein (c-di-GMP phosphodiesterase class II)/DNA-binding CsgD family transcriptional regulator